jgi:hypothetical protein
MAKNNPKLNGKAVKPAYEIVNDPMTGVMSIVPTCGRIIFVEKNTRRKQNVTKDYWSTLQMWRKRPHRC